MARLVLENTSHTVTIGYKFKTNAPSRYSVKPVYATIAPLEKMEIIVKTDQKILVTDRFLVQSVPLTELETHLDAYKVSAISSINSGKN